MYYFDRRELAKFLGVTIKEVEQLIKDGEFDEIDRSSPGSLRFDSHQIYKYVVNKESAMKLTSTPDIDSLTNSERRIFHETRTIRAKITKLKYNRVHFSEVEGGLDTFDYLATNIQEELYRLFEDDPIPIEPRSNLDSELYDRYRRAWEYAMNKLESEE